MYGVISLLFKSLLRKGEILKWYKKQPQMEACKTSLITTDRIG
jgi:hypothetical protein